jgi:hypothetical protein
MDPWTSGRLTLDGERCHPRAGVDPGSGGIVAMFEDSNKLLILYIIGEPAGL